MTSSRQAEHLHKRGQDNLIRLGIACTGTTFREWQFRCLENLLAIDYVQLALLIIDESHSKGRLWYQIKKLLNNTGRALFYVYMIFACKPHAQRQVNMSVSFSNVPSIRCKVIKKGKFSEYFSQADIETIRQYDLDVILRFGFNIIRGEILKVPRYGVWSFHHDDEEKYRGAPPCFWEIYNRDNVTGAMLQKLTDRLDGGVVLKKGFFPTIDYSYAKNIDQAFYESAKWPAQVCIDIRNGNANYLNNSSSQTKAPIYYDPNNLQMLVFVAKLLRNFLTTLLRVLFFRKQWNIGVIHSPIITFLEPDVERPKIHWAPAPKRGKFIADPFGIEGESKVTILCEDFSYGSYKGVISKIELTDWTIFSEPEPVIELPFHISYPYLLEYEGEIYCAPEMCHANEVVLYKAKEFPYKWMKVATLIPNFGGFDPTIFQYEGLWWLMCTCNGKIPNLDLFIWYAQDLLGPWKPHIANPVKTDVRSSRPAGTPFVHNGCLYRPAQDCSRTYGGRIALNRVTRLTPTEFAEEQVGTIEPYTNSAFPIALHTVSSIGNSVLIDGARYEFTIKIIHQFRHMLKQVISHSAKSKFP